MDNRNDPSNKKNSSSDYITRLMQTISGAVEDNGLATFRDDRRQRYTYVKRERPEYFLKEEKEKIFYEAEELEAPDVLESIRKDPPRNYSITSRRTQDLSDINVYSIESNRVFLPEACDAPAEDNPEDTEGISFAEPEQALMDGVELSAGPDTEEETAAAAEQPATEQTQEDITAVETEELHVEDPAGREGPEEESEASSEDGIPEAGEAAGLPADATGEAVASEEEPGEACEAEETAEEPGEACEAEETAEEPDEGSETFGDTAEELSEISAEVQADAGEGPVEEADLSVDDASGAVYDTETVSEQPREEGDGEPQYAADDSGDIILDDDTILDEGFFTDEGTEEIPEEDAVPGDGTDGMSPEPDTADPRDEGFQPGPEEHEPSPEEDFPGRETESTIASEAARDCENLPFLDADGSLEVETELSDDQTIESAPGQEEDPDRGMGAEDIIGNRVSEQIGHGSAAEEVTKEDVLEASAVHAAAEKTSVGQSVRTKNGKIRRNPVGHRGRSAGGYVPHMGIFLSLGILFMDMLMRCVLDIGKDPSRIMDVSTLYTMLFSFAAGFTMDLIISIPRSAKGRRILANVLLAIPSVLYMLEFFLKQTYGNYMGVRVIMGNATAVAGSYSTVIWQVILKGIPMIILFCMPLILLNVLFTKMDRPSVKRVVIVKAVCAVLAFALGIGAVMSSVSGAITDRQYFTSHFNIDKSITRFGLPMSLALDCIYVVHGIPAAKEAAYPVYVPTMAVEGYVNMVDIDFDAITASHDYWPIPQMDAYFASLAPTMKNEYTGMFEGKNLVFIVAEAFTGYVIDPELTPTLYKMANEGFVFENYYQPSWFVSTSDGEYNLLTGLIPDFSIQSMLHTQDKNMYYTPGNVFRRLGYTTMAFHNHDYDYYDRDLTHEHLGYDFWMGMGNGMEEYVEEIWPESDEEMFRGTAHYLTECDGPFHVYYLTVSGHTEYNFEGNYMAKKNRDYIDGTGLSEQVWAIRAQNLELERGLAYLMEALEEAGKLDDTVFVMSCDHYPYGMPDWAYNELAGKELDTVFERYHNTLFIYCSDMEEPVAVDKYCYGPDVMPTVLNLFGVEYDSRLFSGRDILSDTEGLVIFNNYSWITAKARYNANSGVMYPAEGAEIPDGYQDTVSRVVADRIKYAQYILNYDYYDIVFGQ